MFQTTRILLLSAAAIFFATGVSAKEPLTWPGDRAGDWATMRSIVPREYLCHFSRERITIDGRATEAAWKSAEWTADFADIQGSRLPKPRFRTRAKMLWDDENFYVYAELDDPHVWATITKKNEVMFHDNDFEVFIDPMGSNHHYYEFEINANNAIWELSLDAPYRDGGPIHNPDNLPGLRSAVHVRGTLNDPSDADEGWSVEIAYPWRDLKKFAGKMAAPPREGDRWRVDMSRVEWMTGVVDGKYRKIEKRPEDNWVWSPQGVINMHAPERWGRVQFTRQPPGEGKFVPDPTAAARDALMELYHRERAYHDFLKRYAASIGELGFNPRQTPGVVAGSLKIEPTKDGFIATVVAKLPDGSTETLHTRQDSYIWRDEPEQSTREAKP